MIVLDSSPLYSVSSRDSATTRVDRSNRSVEKALSPWSLPPGRWPSTRARKMRGSPSTAKVSLPTTVPYSYMQCFISREKELTGRQIYSL